MFQLFRQKRSQKQKVRKRKLLWSPARVGFAQDGDSLSATTFPNAADA
jgi:hypothetical protein